MTRRGPGHVRSGWGNERPNEGVVAENNHCGFTRPVPTFLGPESKTLRVGIEHAPLEVGHLGGGTMRTQLKWILTMLLAFSIGGAIPGHAQELDSSGEPPSGAWQKFGEPAPTDPLPLPSTLTFPAGSWITVRVDQWLSSDRNQAGDAFTATLAQPLVANGRVIARRGQTVGGAVTTAEKAGRVKGTSRLRLELTELSLVDGRQIQVKTTLMERRGDTSAGRDIAAVGTSTGVGAAIGAAADGGFGAGIGAIAGAAASTIGVLVTRGRPTVVYPEDQLTFRLEAPLAISVGSSEEAFQPVRQEDYEQPRLVQRGPSTGPPPPEYNGGYYGGYYPPYYYGYYPPFFYGPRFVFYSHPRYFNHRGYYGRHR